MPVKTGIHRSILDSLLRGNDTAQSRAINSYYQDMICEYKSFQLGFSFSIRSIFH